MLFGFAPTLALAGVGVVLWGFGAALAVPIGIAAASDDPMRAAGRVAVVSSFASVASIAAPPLLGIAAAATGARHALVLITVAMVASVALARRVAPERDRSGARRRRSGASWPASPTGAGRTRSLTPTRTPPRRGLSRHVVPTQPHAPPPTGACAMSGPVQDDRPVTTTHARLVERASVAVFVVFFLNGFNFATWAARLPAIRDGLDFSPAQMGALLLVGAVGSLLSLPLSGMVVERLGARTDGVHVRRPQRDRAGRRVRRGRARARCSSSGSGSSCSASGPASGTPR